MDYFDMEFARSAFKHEFKTSLQIRNLLLYRQLKRKQREDIDDIFLVLCVSDKGKPVLVIYEQISPTKIKIFHCMSLSSFEKWENIR
ncbi:MAG: hypothetical protein LBB10_03195 [Bifidobacteriaceae bacterium]|jgi:hypothetical protein|nr:hypothetical protein [Bifidobacteriaceae bacterium]